jgi:RecB family exonuclease
MKPRLYLSHSSIQTLQSCPRKFEFNKFYQLDEREETMATECGKALHEAYQEYLSSGDVQAADKKLLLAYPYQLSIGEDTRTLEACYATLDAMIANNHLRDYELATVVTADGKEMPAIEVPFEIRLELPFDAPFDVSYIGYIDAIMRHKVQAKYLVVDIKTTTSVPFNREAKYKFSNQCLPYGLVVEHIVNENLKDFDVAYLEAVISLANPTVDKFVYRKTKEDVASWIRGLLIWVHSIVQMEMLGTYVRNGGNCTVFRKTCKYFRFCEANSRTATEALMECERMLRPREGFEPAFTINVNLAS